MIEQQNYIYFKKGMLTATFNGADICFPPYIDRAAKRYRFNSNRLTLEKQCAKCEEWLPCCKFENDSFKKINNEDELHYLGISSGFSTYCQNCNKTKSNAKHLDNNINVSLSQGDAILHTPNGRRSYLNMVINEDLKRYLKFKALLENKNITIIITEILNNYRYENPLDISINQKRET